MDIPCPKAIRWRRPAPPRCAETLGRLPWAADSVSVWSLFPAGRAGVLRALTSGPECADASALGRSTVLGGLRNVPAPPCVLALADQRRGGFPLARCVPASRASDGTRGEWEGTVWREPPGVRLAAALTRGHRTSARTSAREGGAPWEGLWTRPLDSRCNLQAFSRPAGAPAGSASGAVTAADGSMQAAKTLPGAGKRRDTLPLAGQTARSSRGARLR